MGVAGNLAGVNVGDEAAVGCRTGAGVRQSLRAKGEGFDILYLDHAGLNSGDACLDGGGTSGHDGTGAGGADVDIAIAFNGFHARDHEVAHQAVGAGAELAADGEVGKARDRDGKEYGRDDEGYHQFDEGKPALIWRAVAVAWGVVHVDRLPFFDDLIKPQGARCCDGLADERQIAGDERRVRPGRMLFVTLLSLFILLPA